MILPLRQRHRRTFLALSGFLPAVFAFGIVARKPVSTNGPESLSFPLVRTHFETVEWTRKDLFVNTPLEVRLTREQKAAGRFAFEFVVPKDFLKPDLLVYWAAGIPTSVETLPSEAILLGALHSAAPLFAPTHAALSDGVLIVYSLADQEIIQASKPFALRQP